MHAVVDVNESFRFRYVAGVARTSRAGRPRYICTFLVIVFAAGIIRNSVVGKAASPSPGQHDSVDGEKCIVGIYQHTYHAEPVETAAAADIESHRIIRIRRRRDRLRLRYRFENLRKRTQRIG